VGESAIDVSFDRDVWSGDASRLTVYGSDSTCTTPKATGTYGRREGTNRIRVFADGFVPGRNYVDLGEGLAKTSVGEIGSIAARCVEVHGYKRPTLLSATADAATEVLTLTFDIPVLTIGESPGYRLRVYGTDSSCRSEATRAGAVVDDGDAKVIKIKASGLSDPVTYVELDAGFAAAVDDLASSYPVHCRAVGPG
jgi:hypothetical protein